MKLICSYIVVVALCLSFCIFSSCVFETNTDNDSNRTADPSDALNVTEIVSSTPDTLNPVYKLFNEYNQDFISASFGLTEKICSDSYDINYDTISSVLELMSHNSYLTRVYASIGMLYSYNAGWSGTLTGAYGGIGELFFSDDTYFFTYAFNDGSTMEGQYSGSGLTCCIFDTNGILTYYCELISLDESWISHIVHTDAHSFLEIRTDGLKYASFKGEFTDSARLCEGIDALMEYSEKRLIFENGSLRFESLER